jgi:hypothetical protein
LALAGLVVECVPSKCEALSSNPSTAEKKKLALAKMSMTIIKIKQNGKYCKEIFGGNVKWCSHCENV